MMPGINQAHVAEAAIIKKSTFVVVNAAATAQTQQSIPPNVISLNFLAAPVMIVGKPNTNKR
jgi:hypothetical protein